MMQFVIYAKDKPNNLAHRMEVRPTHLDYWGENGGSVMLAGPLLDANEKPCGSTLILEADTIEAARALAEGDPYYKEGVFGSLEVNATNMFLGKLAPKDD
jgi:uncharacterized protein